MLLSSSARHAVRQAAPRKSGLNASRVNEYAADVAMTLAGGIGAPVSAPLQNLVSAGSGLALIVGAIETALASNPGGLPPALAQQLEQQWDAALASWRTAQAQLDARLRDYLTGALPSLPGLDALTSGIGWDGSSEGLRGSFSLGPVTLGLDGSTLQFQPPFANRGVEVLGPLRPDTIRASLSGPFSGGGALRILPDGASGILHLAFGVIDVTAMASLRRLPPGGDASFLTILGIGFTPGIQIGFGFAISRIGGLVGVNRAADTRALSTHLRSGTAGDVLFAEDPIRDAARLLSAVEMLFAPRLGRHLAGPSFQISWLKIAGASFFTFDLAVIIEFPGPSKILLLGVAKAGVGPLLKLRLDLLGWIDFAQREVGFDASLVDSGALGIFTISGDASFRLSYGSNPYALVTIGGFYPGYNPEPAVLPPLRRVGLGLDSPLPGLFIRVEGYFAVSTNTLQFGGRFECGFDLAVIEASGFLEVDFLIQFTPFYFAARVAAGFRVRVAGITFMGITLEGSICGPGPVVISGRLTIEVFLFEISWHDTFTIGSGGGPPQAPHKLLLDELAPELSKQENLRISAASDRLVVLEPRSSHGTRAAVSPVGELEWRQRRAPLGIPIDRLEGAPLGSVQGVAVASTAKRGVVTDLFSPGSFVTLTQSEALNRPAFDTLEAGIVAGFPGAIEGAALNQTAKVHTIRKVIGEPDPVLDCTQKVSSALGFPGIVLELSGQRVAAPGVSSLAPHVAVAPEPWETADGRSHTSATAAHQYVRHRVGGMALPAEDAKNPVSLAGV